MEWPPLAVRNRQIFNYKRMDMLLIQLKTQGEYRKSTRRNQKDTQMRKETEKKIWKIRD